MSACEFDAAVSAIVVAKDGKEVDIGAVSTDIHKVLAVLEHTLNGKKYFAGGDLSIADFAWAASLGVVFSVMLGEAERSKYPNLSSWYTGIIALDANLGPKDLPKDGHKAFKPK